MHRVLVMSRLIIVLLRNLSCLPRVCLVSWRASVALSNVGLVNWRGQCGSDDGAAVGTNVALD